MPVFITERKEKGGLLEEMKKGSKATVANAIDACGVSAFRISAGSCAKRLCRGGGKWGPAGLIRNELWPTARCANAQTRQGSAAVHFPTGMPCGSLLGRNTDSR